MPETPKLDLFDTASEFLKTLGLDDIFPKPSTESEDAPESKDEEERHAPFDEAVRLLKKIEKNVDNGDFMNGDLFGVADRYIRIGEIALQWDLVDN